MQSKSNKRAAESHLKVVPLALRLSEVDDSQLVSLCQKGDVRAFEMLVRRHQRTVFGLLFRLALDWDSHCDLAQEVFIRMWRNIGRLKNWRALKSWIAQITTHLFYDELRKRPKQLRVLSLQLAAVLEAKHFCSAVSSMSS